MSEEQAPKVQASHDQPGHHPDSIALDLESMKVLAHPLRVQIVDALSKHGPNTASGLAQQLGESSGATSYHLRQLAKYDFVREVDKRGTARERWWERSPRGIELNTRELSATIAGRTAADLLARQWQLNSDRELMDFQQHGVDVFSPAWLDASVVSNANLRLTVEQFTALTGEVMRVVHDFADRYQHQRENAVPGSRPVQVQFNAFPLIDGKEA